MAALIQAPSNSGSLYYNYKGTFSIVLLAIVDANYCFQFIDVGACGRENDSGILKKTDFYRKLEENELGIPNLKILPSSKVHLPPFFIGDEAFPLKRNILRPYPGTKLEFEQRIFN